MSEKHNILELIREREAQALRRTRRGVILQPGAIGDCILTLALARFVKDSLGLGAMDIFGRTEYLGIFPGRTSVDTVRSTDLIDLHRLFVDKDDFHLADGDRLIDLFADYSWIISFLAQPNSHFEQNLIFTANCSRSAEVVTLATRPPPHVSHHVTRSYIRQFIDQCGLALETPLFSPEETLIYPTPSDLKKGKQLFSTIGIASGRNTVVIHPGSGGFHKCWNIHNFLAIAEQLIADGRNVIFLLGPAELERFAPAKIAAINDTAKSLTNLSLTEVLQLISCAGAFLGNDSGITHLAAAMGITTAAVFGPTDPKLYRPIGPAVSTFTDHSQNFTRRPSPALQHQILTTLTKSH